MTDNEKLARWQGFKPHPNGVSCYLGELKLIGGTLKWPDYLNDDAAAMSLLDTLVERGFEYVVDGRKHRTDCSIYVRDEDEIVTCFANTRREAVIAAVLEFIGKEDV